MEKRWILIPILVSFVIGGCGGQSDEPDAGTNQDAGSTGKVSREGWEIDLPSGWREVPIRFGVEGSGSVAKIALASYDTDGAELRDVCQPGAVTDQMGSEGLFVELMTDPAGNPSKPKHIFAYPRISAYAPRECGEKFLARWNQNGVPVIARIWTESKTLTDEQQSELEELLGSLNTTVDPVYDGGIIRLKDMVPPARIRTSKILREMVLMVPPMFIIYKTCGEIRNLEVERFPGSATTRAWVQMDGELVDAGNLLKRRVGGKLGNDTRTVTVIARQSTSAIGHTVATAVLETPPGVCQGLFDAQVKLDEGSD